MRMEAIVVNEKKTAGIFSRHLPLILYEIFLWAVYLIYRVGPWMFPYRKDSWLLYFMIGVTVCFAIGYLLRSLRRERKAAPFKTISTNTYALALIAVNLVFFIPYCIEKTGSWYPPLFTSLQNLGVAYIKSGEVTSQSVLGIMHNVLGVMVIFRFPLPILLYMYWGKIKKLYRGLGVALCLWYYLVDVCLGRNRAIAILAIVFLILFIVKLCTRDFRQNKKGIVVLALITALLMVVTLVYFSTSIGDRGRNTVAYIEQTGQTVKESQLNDVAHVEMIEETYRYNEPEHVAASESTPEFHYDDPHPHIVAGEIPQGMIDAYTENSASSIAIHPFYADEYSYSYLNLEDPIFKGLPDSLKWLYTIGTNYVSHGFHGVSIAFRLPYDWAYGVGSLPILQSAMSRLTGVDVYEKTYVYKVNQAGYPVSLKWGTAFLQFASDFTFPGTVLLMGLFGYLLAALWLESIQGSDFITLTSLAILVVNLLFITSWWLPGMSGTDLILFYGYLSAWCLRKVWYWFAGRAKKA